MYQQILVKLLNIATLKNPMSGSPFLWVQTDRRNNRTMALDYLGHDESA
jgi:hypothetical protein